MCLCICTFYFGETLHGYSIWYYNAAAIAAANACFHIWGVVKLKSYSPGVITGAFLYIPVFVTGTIQLVGLGEHPLLKAIIAIALAAGYHVFSIIRQGDHSLYPNACKIGFAARQAD